MDGAPVCDRLWPNEPVCSAYLWGVILSG